MLFTEKPRNKNEFMQRKNDNDFLVDEDSPQLMESGDSYFLNDDYPGCMGPVDSLQSEEEVHKNGRP